MLNPRTLWGRRHNDLLSWIPSCCQTTCNVSLLTTVHFWCCYCYRWCAARQCLRFYIIFAICICSWMIFLIVLKAWIVHVNVTRRTLNCTASYWAGPNFWQTSNLLLHEQKHNIRGRRCDLTTTASGLQLRGYGTGTDNLPPLRHPDVT